jgi:hypothetical protein
MIYVRELWTSWLGLLDVTTVSNFMDWYVSSTSVYMLRWYLYWLWYRFEFACPKTGFFHVPAGRANAVVRTYTYHSIHPSEALQGHESYDSTVTIRYFSQSQLLKLLYYQKLCTVLPRLANGGRMQVNQSTVYLRKATVSSIMYFPAQNGIPSFLRRMQPYKATKESSVG